jgi:O-antigen/teichoic acid export membrane protein
MVVSTGLRAIFPFMTELYQINKEKFNTMLAEGFTLVLILGSTIAMLLTVTSSIWLPLFFGSAYNKSILVFNYQAWLGVILCFDLILANVLSSSYRQKILAIIMTIDVLIIFPLMYIGAGYGANGMALAKLIGGIITVLYHVVVVIVVLGVRLKSLSFLLSCIYFVTMMVITIFISDMSIKLIVVSILILSFLVFDKSPLRQLIRLCYNYSNKK